MFGIRLLRAGVARNIGGLAGRLDARAASLAAGLVLAVAPLAVAVPGVDLLEVRPGHFSPNGDGVYDTASLSFVPTGAADSVDVRVEVVRDADSTVVATLVAAGTVPADSAVVTDWDPGPTIEDGTYRFDILVVDGPDSLVERAYFVSDTTATVLQFGTIAPNPFDPGADPPEDQLRVPLTITGGEDDETAVLILGATGLSVDTLGVFSGSGDSTFFWDGLSSGGAPAGSGTYLVRAVAADLAGNTALSQRTFVLDEDAPVFAEPSPGTIETDAFPVTVAGSVTDDDLVVAVQASHDGGDTFVAADSISATPADSVAWSFVVADSAPVPSLREVLVRAWDAQGHFSDVIHRIAYDSPLPVADSTVVSGTGSVPDGGTLEIRSHWNRSGLEVTVNFSALDSNWISGQESIVEITPGTYRIRYDVSASNTKLPGDALVAVNVSTGFVTGSDTVAVRLEDRGPAEEAVSIDRNSFDPDAGDRVTIIAEAAGTALDVEIWNLGGSLVRHLQGSGQVRWNGRSEDGNIAASGVYFLKVTAGDREELRKVAIVRGSGS